MTWMNGASLGKALLVVATIVIIALPSSAVAQTSPFSFFTIARDQNSSLCQWEPVSRNPGQRQITVRFCVPSQSPY